jgi:hypothetical protein
VLASLRATDWLESAWRHFTPTTDRSLPLTVVTWGENGPAQMSNHAETFLLTLLRGLRPLSFKSACDIRPRFGLLATLAVL